MGLPKSSVGSLLLLIGVLAIGGVAQDRDGAAVPDTSTEGATAAATDPALDGGSVGAGGQTATRVSRGFWVELFSNPVSFLLLFMVVFYLMLILPGYRANKKSQRELDERLSSLKKNDRVVTSFGVHGVVSGIHGESGTVTLRIDENTNAKLTVNRETIRVVKKD